MKPAVPALLHILVLHLLVVLSASQNFDFFYFVQQWPGSSCDAKQECCYPPTGKPASDFGIHGLWPQYNNGMYPSNCDSSNSFDASKISDLTSRMQTDWPSLACPSSTGVELWSHEWQEHGTCSYPLFDQHRYFETALNLKKKVNLLRILGAAGIQPVGSSYTLESVEKAIKDGSGYTPFIECNVDDFGNSRLYRIYLCVNNSGSDFIECPVTMRSPCDGKVEFPAF